MLDHYSFEEVGRCFPSLTSLTLSNCTDPAIEQIVQPLKLEEPRFREYTVPEHPAAGVRTTQNGFLALSRAASLRSIQYTPSQNWGREVPSLIALTALFTLTNLTRLSVSAAWLPEYVCVQLFAQHDFVHLRCLELVEQFTGSAFYCPQSDEALLPLVKPADMAMAGRKHRQAMRAASRPLDPRAGPELSGRKDKKRTIPAHNVANLPALECLALP